jgi:hypothetical protein
MADYEVWVCDDSGARIQLLRSFAFLTYSRTTNGYGTVHLGVPYKNFSIRPLFLPDRRLDIWRAAGQGVSARREGSFFLRKWNAYTRQEDGVDMLEFFGRSPVEILRRQAVVSYTAANYSKTDYADDMMKEIVTQNFISPQQTAPAGELVVSGDESLGPSISHSFFGGNVLDVLKDIRAVTFSMNKTSPTLYRKIYFDVVEGAALSNGGFGYMFRTYANLRGTDRTLGVVYSRENGNIKDPSYYEDHLDAFTMVDTLNSSDATKNGAATSSDRYLSRWNDAKFAQGTSETTVALNNSIANQVLTDKSVDKALNVTFIDSPGSERQPRSLYGVDWDLGDILPARYVEKNFQVEVAIVYVSLDQDGRENITGLSQVQ